MASCNLFRCDGIMHCPNGEDETKDCEKKGNCKEDQFTCSNNECISLKDRCNSHFDCTDQSDEENCDKPKCENGNCGDTNVTCIVICFVLSINHI